ncbi:type I-E CRISPR-associated protein Cse2/CasB [Salana multivorans]
MNQTADSPRPEDGPGSSVAPSGPKRGTRRRTAFGHNVADRATKLQKLSNENQPAAVRTMAILRRAASAQPGTVPDVWEDTIGLVPDEIADRWRGDDPSPAELAAHHAVTLFAMHRQGRLTAAHVVGVGPGRAFARLARVRGETDNDKGVRRRFDAMMTATSPEESARHLRGLVQLLRAEDIGLDYGLLAEDLEQLWTPATRDRARLRWARQYNGLSASSSEDDETAVSPNASSPTAPTSEETA